MPLTAEIVADIVQKCIHMVHGKNSAIFTAGTDYKIVRFLL